MALKQKKTIHRYVREDRKKEREVEGWHECKDNTKGMSGMILMEKEE